MKLSKKGAVTLATALVVFLVTTGLMLSRVKDLESSYDEQSKANAIIERWIQFSFKWVIGWKVREN